MKLDNDWRNRTLESLEKNVWPHNSFGSHLVTRTQVLRKIPLKDFSTEDLRIMIGQQIGLDYLVPLALETLTENLLEGGDYFEGDLLRNVLAIKTEFWNDHKEYWVALHNLIKDNREKLKKAKLDVAAFEDSKHKC